MTHRDALSEWTTWVSSNRPHLSKPQATVLAWWRFGIAITRSCGRVTVATFLALLLTRKVATVAQRLSEWWVEAPRKAGTQRQALDVTTCLVPFLAWIVRLWQGTQLALTLDATTLSDRCVVLSVSVVSRGIGIPVAWTVRHAGRTQAWRREWLRMLRLLRPAIPRDGIMLVLADRGLDARWRFRRIVRLGGHPFLRINTGVKGRPAGQAHWCRLRDLLSADGRPRHLHGTCCKDPASHLTCTLLVWSDDRYPDPRPIDPAGTAAAAPTVGARTLADDTSPVRAGASSGTRSSFSVRFTASGRAFVKDLPPKGEWGGHPLTGSIVWYNGGAVRRDTNP